MKKKLFLIVSVILILFSFLSPSLLTVSADANEEFEDQVSSYVGDADEFKDVFSKIMEENPNSSKNTISHVMKRIFHVGEYINDVEYAVVADELDMEKSDLLVDERYACNPNSPNNLINHNCNIPNFTTGLIQNIASPFMSPLSNAGKTSSYSTFGFGVPNNIPGDIVPIKEEEREHTYTALELYGYDLKLTSYNGEWDRIDVSNQARMLSNFGVIDNLTLLGTGLWNSITGGVGALIENFSFNPIRWIGGVADAFETALTGGVNTVLDTSDLNIIATNGWKRENFGGTLYNVYVMTDKEVLRETYKNYFKVFISQLRARAEVSPELLEVLDLEAVPDFTFIPDWETEESIADRESAKAHNSREDAFATGDPEYSPNYVTVPEPVYYTEKEQLGFWGEDNSDIISRAAAQGLISSDVESYNTYDLLVQEWQEEWEKYFTREFDALGPVVDELIERSDIDIFLNNPHLDPKQPISHYACANDDGSLKRSNDGGIEYLYLRNNEKNKEFLNPNCKPARPPIGGGLFGSGWHVEREPDTRHIDNVGEEKGPIEVYLGKVENILASFGRALNSFIAKFTNVVLGLSFSPILNELGIDTLVGEIVEGFKETIFFPLAALAIIIGAVILFFQVLRERQAMNFIVSIFITTLIFIGGSVFLMNPENTINVIDKWPSQMDNFLANAVLVDDDGTSYCSTGSEEDGIRSAQCNVWGAMVFNPWVHLQFGTGYDNLYANGYAPDNGKSFKNTNQDLVGNASVNLGGGEIVNNWALYQLDQTKSGTINANSLSEGIARVDKDMYRLVDLQAGPNNGEGTDSRYFSTWSGEDVDLAVVFLTNIQAIILSIAIIGLGFTKIETSLLFSLSIILLPFMLLYSFLPKGRIKLKNYLSYLGSLLLKRAMVTIMLSILLKTITLSYSSSDSIVSASILSIAISVAFILYKKEIFNMISSTEGDGMSSEIKNLMSENTPKFVKQNYQESKAKLKGLTSGFIGGATGSLMYKAESDKKARKAGAKIRKLERKGKKTELSQEEKDKIEDLKLEVSSVAKQRVDKNNNMFKRAIYGARDSSQIISSRAEKSMRRKGFSIDNIYKDAKENVENHGADSITNKDEPMELDMYKEILSHGESNKSKTSTKKLTHEEARLLANPKIQKEVRRLAKERIKDMNENKDNKDYTSITKDVDELEKLAKKIDKKRKSTSAKNIMFRPWLEKEIYEKRQELEKSKNVSSNSEEIKRQILEEQQRRKEEQKAKEGDKNE